MRRGVTQSQGPKYCGAICYPKCEQEGLFQKNYQLLSRDIY